MATRVSGPMQATNYNPIIDTNNTALVANGVSVGSTGALKDWINGRRTFPSDELAKVAAPFEISSNNGNNYSTNNPSLLLIGKAPVAAAFLRINGASTNAPVTWTTVTNWSLNWTLTNGANPITVQGYGRTNDLLSGLSDSITITYQP